MVEGMSGNEGWGNNTSPGIGHNSGNEGWGMSANVAEIPNVQTFEIVYASQPETEEPEAFRERRNAEIQNWLEAKKRKDIEVEIEKASRAKVTKTLFPTNEKGTRRYDLGGGYKVKLGMTFKYELGDKDAEDGEGNKITIESQVQAVEAEIIEKYGEVGEQILKRVVRWKPELSGSEFEKLNANNDAEAYVKEKLREITTIKPNSPQLSFEEPAETV